MAVTASTVSTKGQVVIPKDIRQRLGLRAGDRVEFSIHEGHAHLQKQAGDALKAFLSGPKARWRKGELDNILAEQYQ